MKRLSFLSIIALMFTLTYLFCGSALADGLRAWGNDCCGQLSELPTETHFVAIAAGKEQGLGLTQGGIVIAWGTDYQDLDTVPVGLGLCRAIGAGWKHSLVIKTDGSLAAWGENYDGQCTVPAGTDYDAVDGGEYYSIALKTDGSIVHWGDDSNDLDEPPAGNDFVAISAGMTHCLALKDNGTVVGWGRNYENQCNVPAGTFLGIAAGKECSFGLKTDGSIVHWGSPAVYGVDVTNVPAGNDYVAISFRYMHGLALKSDGSIVGWGAGTDASGHPHYGQANPPAGTDYTAVATGGYWSLTMITAPGSASKGLQGTYLFLLGD
jgi:alpha-tubulin suppressor-like RCC1 family protein